MSITSFSGKGLEPRKITRVPTAVRPSDWLTLPTLTDSDNKFVGLYAVGDHDSNFLAINMSGTGGNFTVDWGDGNVETWAPGDAYHSYSYAALSASSTSTLGYRQAIVSVTPQSGTTFTGLNLQVKHTQSGLPTSTAATWLDASIAGASVTSLGIGCTPGTAGTVVINVNDLFSFRMCRTALTSTYYLFYNCGALCYFDATDAATAAVTDMSYMFYSCYSLRTVPLFNTSAVTNMSNMFNICTALQTVPLLNTANVTDMSSMFLGCNTLRSVPLLNTSAVKNMNSMFSSCMFLTTVPLFNTTAAVSMSAMFNSCRSLQSVPLFDTSAVQDMTSMFNTCYNLESVPLFNTSAARSMASMFANCSALKTVPLFDTTNVTTMNSMFSSCGALQYVPQFNTPALTNAGSMFASCYVIQSVPLLDTADVTTITSMFSNCRSLQTVPAMNTSGPTTFSSIFTGCGSLSQCSLSGTRSTISFSNSRLSKTAIETVFTNLGKANGTPTITITNNWGATTNASFTLTGSTTSGSTTMTMASTAGIVAGQLVTGNGISSGRSVTFQGAGDTVTLNGHGIANGTRVSFSAVTTTTGITTYTYYYVVNAATNTFQLEASVGGGVLPLTNDGTGTILFGTKVVSVIPNTSIQLSIPAGVDSTNANWTFRNLDTSLATMKGWTVSG